MYKFLFPLILIVTSCSETSGTEPTNENPTIAEDQKEIDHHSIIENSNIETEENSNIEAEKAKKWLIDAIDRHFNSNDVHSFDEITTKEYCGLKTDLINSNFAHGIDLDSIKKKWSYKYDISSEDIDVGFLIDAQDNGKIEIERCSLMNSSPDPKFEFGVSLYDTLFKSHYQSDITVIPYKGSFAIDNVKEHWK